MGFEPTTPASERPETHALDRAAIGTGVITDMRSEIYNKFTKFTKFTRNLQNLQQIYKKFTKFRKFTTNLQNLQNLQQIYKIYKGRKNMHNTSYAFRWVVDCSCVLQDIAVSDK